MLTSFADYRAVTADVFAQNRPIVPQLGGLDLVKGFGRDLLQATAQREIGLYVAHPPGYHTANSSQYFPNAGEMTIG